MKKTRLLPLTAAIAAIGLGAASGGALADAYFIAYQNVQNGSIAFSGQGQVVTGNGLNSSDTSASLTGFASDGDSDVQPRGVLADANPAEIGVNRTNNVFNSFVVGGTTTSFATADAAILSEQLVGPGTDALSAANIAEGYVAGNTLASALGSNVSNTAFRVNFVVSGSQVDLAFSFDNDPYIEIFTDAQGQTATATLEAVFTLTNSGTGDVITWRPNGFLNAGDPDIANAGGGFTGTTATESTDDADLNTSLSTGFSNTGPLDGPIGSGGAATRALLGAGGAALLANSSSSFLININALNLGEYSLALSMTEKGNASNAVVPEPSIVGLMGIGLLGIGIGKYRRKKANS